VDRASRYTEDFARLIRLSEDQGWRLIVSEMGIDTRTPMDNQAGGIGHITQHVIRLQFERVRRAVGETPLEDLERIVQARAPHGARRKRHSGRGSGHCQSSRAAGDIAQIKR
jgi:DNA invertase Pin-like site-specific DNA recombinase